MSLGAQSQIIAALSGGGAEFYASQNATPLEAIAETASSSAFITFALSAIIISIVVLAAQTSADLQDKSEIDMKKTLAATAAALKSALQQAAASELEVETRRRQWNTASAAALQEQFEREVKLNVERGTARANAKYYQRLAETCAANYRRFSDELKASTSAKIEAQKKEHIVAIEAALHDQERAFAERTAQYSTDASAQRQSAIAAAFRTGSEGAPPALLFNGATRAAHDVFELEKKKTLADHARATASLTSALEAQTQKNVQLVAAAAAAASALDARTVDLEAQTQRNKELAAAAATASRALEARTAALEAAAEQKSQDASSLAAALEAQTQKNVELAAAVSAAAALEAAAERRTQELDDAVAASTSALDARTAERLLQAKKNDSLTTERDALSAELRAAEELAVSQREHFEHALAEAEAVLGERTAALEEQHGATLALRVEQLQQESRAAVQHERLKHSEQSTKLRRRRSSLERALASATSANAELEASLVVAIEELRSTPDVDAAPTEALVAQLRGELDAEAQRLQAQLDARIEAAAAQRAEHADTVAELEAQHAAAIAATIDEHTSLRESSVAALAAQHEETIASAIEAHLTPLKERAAQLERERSEIAETLDERVTSHEAHASAHKAEHDKAIAAAIGELEETHAAERDSLSAALASAQKKPRSPFKKGKLWKKLKTATKAAKVAKASPLK